jgi:outer membrane protein TolC
VVLKKKTKFTLVSALVVQVFLCASLEADENEAGLKELVEEAVAQNLELRGSRSEWEAASSRVLPGAFPPNPTLGLGLGMIPAEDFEIGSAGMRSIWVSQRIPFPAKLYSRYRSASHMADVAGEVYRMKERAVIWRVKDLYWELCNIHETRKITEETRALLRGLAALAETKYAVGRGSATNVLKVQVELAKLENDLFALKQQLLTAQARLNGLLNRPADQSLGVPENPSLEPVELDSDQLDSLTLSNRPQLLAARKMALAASSAHATSKMDYLPDLMVSVKHQNVEVGMDMWEVMFSVEVPLWLPFKENKRLQETGAALASAEAHALNAANDALAMLRSAHNRYQTARRTLELYETGVLPQAEMSLVSARAAYENDASDFLSLLDAHRTLLRFRVEHAGAKAEYERAIAELELVVGKDIPRGLKEDGK